MDIQDRVALVTGGASGLGLATVEKLHDMGALVVVVDLPDSGGAAAEARLDRATFAPADVTDANDVERVIERAVGLGPLVAAVNCAGIGPAARVVSKDGSPFPLDLFNRVIAVNLSGTFNVTRLAAAAMVANTPVVDEERGVVINTASVAAFDGQVGQAAYAASKGGVVGLTLPLARDLAQHSIRVNTIAPGLFRTPAFDALSEEMIESLGAQVPHPARLGRPSEFAELVSHVIHNKMLNGETVRLDGAIRMAPR